jgi:dolichyl-phosphate beta-glucosyltransferase
MPYLSIIIPAYNEAVRLPDTLALVRDWIERQSFSVEVLVVDDGSTDATAEIVQEFSHRFPAVRLLSNTKNQGKGSVVQQGMLEAQGEWRLFMDADASTPINQIQRLLKETPKHQVIIGSRYLDPASIKIKQPLKRRILSRAVNFLIQLVFLPGIKDTQCGFKLFSAVATTDIFPRQHVKGWLFDVEILTIARQLGYAIREVPVDWYDAKNSKLRTMRTLWRTIRELTAIYHKVRSGAYTTSPKQS